MSDKKKIVILTGAGISAESGIATFRTGEDATWSNIPINQVATPAAWSQDRETVLEFYNDRWEEMTAAEPNLAHTSIGDLEDEFDVTIVTQNVDDLHERGGSSKVYHIHGEINKARSTVDPKIILDWNKPIELGDKCSKGSQLRPHVVWFHEYPLFIDESVRAIQEADYLLVVGTGMVIHYIPNLIYERNSGCKIFYIDPDPAGDLERLGIDAEYVTEPATTGVPKVIKKIKDELSKI
jgi:NAD-dependent deacetylase